MCCITTVIGAARKTIGLVFIARFFLSGTSSCWVFFVCSTGLVLAENASK